MISKRVIISVQFIVRTVHTVCSKPISLRLHQPEPPKGRLLLLLPVDDAGRGPTVSRQLPEAPQNALRRRPLLLCLRLAYETPATEKHVFRHYTGPSSRLHLRRGSTRQPDVGLQLPAASSKQERSGRPGHAPRMATVPTASSQTSDGHRANDNVSVTSLQCIVLIRKYIYLNFETALFPCRLSLAFTETCIARCIVFCITNEMFFSIISALHQCFSAFVRPRPGKFFFL